MITILEEGQKMLSSLPFLAALIVCVIIWERDKRDICKLEEKIAENTDPIAQKELRGLLDKRRVKQKKRQTFIEIAVIIWVILFSISIGIEIYYESERNALELERIQLQREMLDR
jgi:hypothetical protein